MGEMLDLVWMLTSKDADNNTQLATSIAEEIEARSGYPSKALLATRKHPPRGGGAGGQAAEGEEGSSGGGLSVPAVDELTGAPLNGTGWTAEEAS